VRNLEAGLVARGLMAFRDSGNHHRKGRRDRRTGRLVWAYGPSLAPLGVRAGEILALAETARREVAEARRLRIAISALRRRLRAELAAAAEDAIPADDLAAAFAAEPERCPAGLGVAALALRRDRLAALADAARARFAAPPIDRSTDLAGQAAISGPQITDTGKLHAMNGDSIAEKPAKRGPGAEPPIAAPAACGGRKQDRAGSRGPGASTTARRADGADPGPSTAAVADGSGRDGISGDGGGARDGGAALVPLALALAAAGPEITAAAGRQGPPSWRGLVEAAREAAPLLGVGAELWGEACGALGRNGAALAALILERALLRGEGEAARPVARPAAWFRSLVTRAAEGRLHLDRSVRALAQRPAGARAAPRAPDAAP
jgi:replication initiation protein RepC